MQVTGYTFLMLGSCCSTDQHVVVIMSKEAQDTHCVFVSNMKFYCHEN